VALPLPAGRLRLAVRTVALGVVPALALGPWSAGASPDPETPSVGAERQAAEGVLDDVEDVLARPAPRRARAAVPRVDLTLQLRDLRTRLGDLGAADRAEARALLARPTDGYYDPEGDGYAKPQAVRNDCTVSPAPHAQMCLHWVPASSEPANAPSPVDEDGDKVPDFVETAREELDHVWQRIVTRGGYRAPLADPGPQQGAGPDARLDVYLTDIGDNFGLYGYCVPEFAPGGGLRAAGYCVLDNDYDPEQYGAGVDPLDNLRVTAAHEFFHAVQFGYDYTEDPWLMEGTAAWIEDEIYDHIDDNQQFIPGGHMTHPRVPLDAPGYGSAGWYTSWTWWRYLSEVRFPDDGGTGLPLIVRQVWSHAAGSTPRQNHSMLATARAISAAGGTFTGVFAAYGEAKRRPDAVFEEGARYRRAPVMRSFRVDGGTRTRVQTATLPHLTSQTYTFVPGAATAATSWRLRIPVDAPDKVRGSHAQVSVVRDDGRRVVRQVRLNARGKGSVVTDFSSAQVARVELTITNASRRYKCWAGTDLACRGRSLDDGLRTTFRGVTFRA
jgi:hypothetical protein